MACLPPPLVILQIYSGFLQREDNYFCRRMKRDVCFVIESFICVRYHKVLSVTKLMFSRRVWDMC